MQTVSPNYIANHRTRTPLLTAFLGVVLATGCMLLPQYARVPVLICVATFLLLAFPEIALGLYPYAGTFKSNPSIASISHADLTVALAMVVAIAGAIRVARTGKFQRLPKAFFFFFPLVLMMLVSLTYTPDLEAGVDKALRFIGLTGIAIISPFALLTSALQFQRFITTLLGSGVVVALTSFSLLGTHSRLVAPGGDTIALGYVTGVAIAILWVFVHPRLARSKRILLFPVSAVLLTALLGSGARGATIATATCLALALFFSRKLLIDAVILGVAGLLMLSSIPIPQASYDYLATLTNQSPLKALSFRNDLMNLGARLTIEHPLGGVGIGGFPFVSPNPRLYDYPHNVVLEISAEMGIVPALAFVCLWGAAFRRTIGQLRTDDFRYKAFSRVTLTLLVFGTIDMVKSGDINNIRIMWIFMSLPYVVANLNSDNAEQTYVDTSLMSDDVQTSRSPSTLFEFVQRAKR